MVIRTKGFATATGNDENLAFAYCTDETGYCLSVCRTLDDELVEVMVVDQINHKTREVTVELSRDCLWLRLSPAAAGELDNITEYTVALAATDGELRDLDEALSVIFSGGNRGEYIKRF